MKTDICILINSLSRPKKDLEVSAAAGHESRAKQCHRHSTVSLAKRGVNDMSKRNKIHILHKTEVEKATETNKQRQNQVNTQAQAARRAGWGQSSLTFNEK